MRIFPASVLFVIFVVAPHRAAADPHAQQICILNPLPGSDSVQARRGLLDAYGSAIARHLACDASVDLVNPPAWGKTVSSATHGRVDYHRSFADGFVFKLHLQGLLPGHLYILTLNGNAKLAGNSLLPTPVPGLADEHYYDFLFVRTDESGAYDGDLAVHLLRGDYRARFYVKDASDFKIVLYHDYFPFQVR